MPEIREFTPPTHGTPKMLFDTPWEDDATGASLGLPPPRRGLDLDVQYPSIRDSETVARLQAENRELRLAALSARAEFAAVSQGTRELIDAFRAVHRALIPIGRANSGHPWEAVVEFVRGEPVEDGVIHLAEASLAVLARTDPEGIRTRVAELVEVDPQVGADLLRLLGRIEDQAPESWYALAAKALESDNVVLRDAAVSALECWRGAQAVAILEQHQESLGWLAEHIEALLREMR